MANALAFGLLCVVLITAAVTDMRTGNIYDWLTIPAALIGLLFWTAVGLTTRGWGGALDGFTHAGLALLAGFLPALFFLYHNGIHAGDAKLIAAIGAVSGSSACVLGTAVYGLPMIMLMAIVVMFRRKVAKQTMQRVSGAVASVFSRKKPELPNDSPRVPIAVGLCIGGIIAGIEQLLSVKLILG